MPGGYREKWLDEWLYNWRRKCIFCGGEFMFFRRYSELSDCNIIWCECKTPAKKHYMNTPGEIIEQYFNSRRIDLFYKPKDKIALERFEKLVILFEILNELNLELVYCSNEFFFKRIDKLISCFKSYKNIT